MTPPDHHTPGIWRALFMDNLRNPARWAGLAGVLAVLVVILLFTVRIPARIDYVTATILTTTPVQRDDGTRPAYTARDIRGRSYPMVSRSALAPAVLTPGDTICLKVQTDRFTGRVTAHHAPGHPDCPPETPATAGAAD